MKKRPILLAAGAALAAALLLLALPSDTAKVKRAFADAAALFAKSGDEPVFVLASKSSAAADLVAGEIEVRVPDLGVSETFDAREAARNALAARGYCRTLEIAFEIAEVTFPARRTARATGDVRVTGTGGGDFVKSTGARALEATLRKGDDGKWRFAEVSLGRASGE